MKATFAIIVTIFITVLTFQLVYALATLRPVPRCQEDVVIIGYGDFERGRWTNYECGPAVDDYIGGH